MCTAFLISSLGAAIIIILPGYLSFIVSFFLIGTGMAILQVAINPLLRYAVSGEHFAFFSIIGQLAFGSASFLSPIFYKFLLDNNNFLGLSLFGDEPWLWIYLLFIVSVSVLILFLFSLKIPDNKSDSEKFDFRIFFFFSKKVGSLTSIFLEYFVT